MKLNSNKNEQQMTQLKKQILQAYDKADEQAKSGAPFHGPEFAEEVTQDVDNVRWCGHGRDYRRKRNKSLSGVLFEKKRMGLSTE